MIPSVVNICGIPHTVIECEDNFTTDVHFGQIEFAKCEIHINKDMPEAMKELTLVHEIMHGMLVMIGQAELGNDEQFVQTLATAINLTFAIRDCEDKQKKPVDDDGLKEAETEMLKSFMAVGEKYLEQSE